jgi:ADP-ribosylglycohydrolase.
MEGSILLGAAGDAMGYVVKFQQVDEIFHQFAGPISFSDPDRWRDHQCGHIVSDDTQMTMFGMEAIARTIEKRSDNFVSFMIDETRISYLEWYETQGRMTVARSGTELLSYREMFANRAPGVTCLDALRLGGHGHVQSPVNDSKGCGGVLRRSRSCLTWKRIRSGCLPPPPPR